MCATTSTGVRVLQLPQLRLLCNAQATPVQQFDFEKVYASYPRKRGKTPGLKRLKRDVKTEQDFADLQKAVSNYALCVKDTADEYMLHFSTFASQWRDWVAPQAQNYTINVTPIDL